MHVSKDIVEKMLSGTHFSKEVAMNMTALAELLETFSDSIFTVSFHKQPTVEGALANLESTSFKDLKDQKKVAALSKLLTQGELC
jgi:predicted transcriptional regulator